MGFTSEVEGLVLILDVGLALDGKACEDQLVATLLKTRGIADLGIAQRMIADRR
jgi:hypothetical protein